MNASTHLSFLQLRSLAKKTGEMELSLQSTSIPTPAPDEVIVRIEAAPINPSDLGLLLANADWSHARTSGTPEYPVLTAPLSANAVQAMAARIDISMPVGNEGAGVVTEAGSSAAAQALMGKTVAVLGGAMYSQYRCVKVNQCLVLPDGATCRRGRIVLRQSTHGARNDRHDAARGAQSVGAHRRGFQSRTDAQSALPRGWHWLW